MTIQNHESVVDTLTKASPPVAVTSLTLFGIDLPVLVQVATLIYVVVLIIDKLYRLYKIHKEKE